MGAIVAVAAYTVWDAGRIQVAEVALVHPALPSAFDGFHIVQVSDLHGATFGEGQTRLTQAIAEARPDIILLTGDYTEAWDSPSRSDLAPLEELVDGLPSGVPVYYVLGNWDARGAYGAGPDIETPLVRVLESHGARPVYPYAKLERAGERIWLTDWTQREFRDEKAMKKALAERLASGDVTASRMEAVYEASWARQEAGHDPTAEFDIAVTHRPLDFADYDAEMARNKEEDDRARAAGYESEFLTEVDFDMNIAGHAHGGQFRLPLIGGLVSPEGRLLPGETWLAGSHTDAKGRVYYISRGLGAGGTVPLTRFRLFNTPELSVLVLRRGN